MLTHIAGLTALLISATALCSAQARGRHSAVTNEAQAVLDGARGLPPEFSSDILLLLVEGGFIRDDEPRQKLLKEAFETAAGAQEKLPYNWPGAGPVSQTFTQLSWLGIDELSLRVRAVREIIKLDSRAARELYDRVQLPLDERFPCEKPFYPKLSTYYSVMPALWDSISDPAERSNFVATRFAQFRSAAQIWPLGVALWDIHKKGREDLASLLYAFGGRMPKLDHDGRILAGELRGAVSILKRLALAADGGGREFLVQQAREWIVQGVRKGCCMDRPARIMDINGNIRREEPILPADLFNSELAPLGKDKPVIAGREVEGKLPGPVWDGDRYSPEYLRFDKMRRLLEQDAAEGKLSQRWHSEVENYVTQLVAWKDPDSDSSDSTAAYYLEKADLLRRMLALRNDPPEAGIPPSNSKYWEARRVAPQAQFLGRNRAAAALVDLYESATAANVYNKRRCIWFHPMRQLIGSAENSVAFDDLLIVSKDPVLHVYGLLAKLQAAAGRTSF